MVKPTFTALTSKGGVPKNPAAKAKKDAAKARVAAKKAEIAAKKAAKTKKTK